MEFVIKPMCERPPKPPPPDGERGKAGWNQSLQWFMVHVLHLGHTKQLW